MEKKDGNVQPAPTDNPRNVRQLTVPDPQSKELACLKALFNHFIKAELIFKNSVSQVKFFEEGNTSDDHIHVLTFEEQNTYLAVCSQPLRDVAILMLETGMRPEEVCRIKGSNVYLDKAICSTRMEKLKLPNGSFR